MKPIVYRMLAIAGCGALALLIWWIAAGVHP